MTREEEPKRNHLRVQTPPIFSVSIWTTAIRGKKRNLKSELLKKYAETIPGPDVFLQRLERHLTKRNLTETRSQGTTKRGGLDI